MSSSRGLVAWASKGMLLLSVVSPALAQSPQINVKTLGCVGDGKHDDTACFLAARQTLERQTIANTATSSDGNRRGQASIYVPPGIYLITAPETLMGSSYHTRTVGYTLDGAGSGATIIEYKPFTRGPLLRNNDAWLNVSISNISFDASSLTSDFIESYSTGGAQDYHFVNVAWVGVWGNVAALSGKNSNSEWDWDHTTFYGAFSNVLYIPPTGTSDQFLNYWFRNSRIWIRHGNFINASKGGHFKITDCDFSGLEGSGDAANPSVLFGLYGKSHAAGVTVFECRNSRFELKTNSVKVLQSEWGNSGQITFQDDDFSSQRYFVGPINEFTIDLSHSGGGPEYNFVRCQLMGFLDIKISNNDWGFRRNITFEDVQFVSFDDFAQGIRFEQLTDGSNYGGFPVVTCTRCRGQDESIYSLDHWQPQHQYKQGDRVFSNGYVYAAQGAGASGSTAPQGRRPGLLDGSVAWSTVDLYYGSDYAQDGQIRPFPSLPTGSNGPLNAAFLSNATDFNKLPRDFSRLILPPYAIVLSVDMVVNKDPQNPATPVKYILRTDDDQPKQLLDLSIPTPRTGYSQEQKLPTPFTAGNTVASRTLVLEATPKATASPSGFFMVTYY